MLTPLKVEVLLLSDNVLSQLSEGDLVVIDVEANVSAFLFPLRSIERSILLLHMLIIVLFFALLAIRSGG